MKSDNDTNYFCLALAYYNVTMQNTLLCFNLSEFLYEPHELGYTSIVTITFIQLYTITIAIELHLIWQLGFKVHKQKIVL